MGLGDWSDQMNETSEMLEIEFRQYGRSRSMALVVNADEEIIGGDVLGRNFSGIQFRDLLERIEQRAGSPVTVSRYSLPELLHGPKPVLHDLVCA